MRREDLYLCDILEAADAIARFIAGVSAERFYRDDLIRSAALQKLLIIGESAARLSDEFKTKIPNVPWREIGGDPFQELSGELQKFPGRETLIASTLLTSRLFLKRTRSYFITRLFWQRGSIR